MSWRLSIYNLAGELTILAGSSSGKILLTKLITTVNRQAEPEPIFLDFEKIEVVTASFFRDAILAFRDYCISARLNLYPVIANASEKVIEELEELLKLLGDAILVCTIDKKDKISSAVVKGILEEKQQVTLKAVVATKGADAATLMEYKKDEDIGITGWNNRLAALAAKGILMEQKRGRGKFYQPVLEMN